jgi:hypothetical protein
MQDKPNANLADLICCLRQRLLEARKNKREEDLARLFSVFGVLEDCAETLYETRDGRLIGIFEEFYCSCRDSTAGEDWKSTIPIYHRDRRSNFLM